MWLFGSAMTHGGMKKGHRGNVPGTLFHPDPAGGNLQIER
jgi:hypothetical protein